MRSAGVISEFGEEGQAAGVGCGRVLPSPSLPCQPLVTFIQAAACAALLILLNPRVP
jgi:hypothetical protein